MDIRAITAVVLVESALFFTLCLYVCMAFSFWAGSDSVNVSTRASISSSVPLFILQAFAGGCAHGWWHGAAVAAKFPPHQRSVVRVRAGAGRGVRFATFALIFEG